MDILPLYKVRQNYIDALNEYGIKPLTIWANHAFLSKNVISGNVSFSLHQMGQFH